MASEIQVYNAAAAAIGSGTRVTSPGDDTTLARSIASVWDLQRRSAIREGSWNFATRRKRLASLTSSPDFGWDYHFALPANCLRLIEVGGCIDGEYQLEGGKLLANSAGPLDIRYLLDVTEPAEWDDLFAEAFSLRIAWTIGTKIAGTAFDKAKVWESYQAALNASKRVDAMENPPIEREESDWILARHSPAPWTGRS